MRKPVLSGLLSIVILLIGAVAMCNSKSFAAQWNTSPGPSRGVAIGDFNTDGVNEIAFSTGTVNVYDKFGVLIFQWTGLNWPTGVAIGDYDNDGLNEVSFAEMGYSTNDGKVSVYKWLPPPSSPTLIYQWTGLGQPQDVTIGDYDTDGLNELAFVECSTARVSVWKPQPPGSPYLMWEWDGLEAAVGVDIGDYNHDAMNEIAFTESGVDTISVYEWQPSSPPALIYQWNTGSDMAHPTGVAIGDYDNDGLKELAFAEAGGLVSQIMIYDWKFSPVLLKIVQDPDVPGTVAFPWALAIGDYNGDGYNDLAWTEVVGERVIVYRWGDLGGLVGGIPTYFTYDDKVDGVDLALFVQCYKKLGPPDAMYLADIGGGFLGPKFFAFDGKVDGYDLALFVKCYKGLGP